MFKPEEDILEQIVSAWSSRLVNGLRLAELLHTFLDKTSDTSVSDLQEVFLQRKMAPPDTTTLMRHLMVWQEWVVKRKQPIDVLAKVGVDRLYYLRTVPIEQSAEWLEKARTMRLKDLILAMGADRPQVSVRLALESREALNEAIDYISASIEQVANEKVANRSSLVEFMAEVFRTMSPTRIAALWKLLHGEAGVEEYSDSMRFMGQLPEEEEEHS